MQKKAISRAKAQSGLEGAGSSRDLGLEAYARMKQAIAEGTFRAGERLTEADVASRLTMSRTPVREAIHRLETEGLLSHESRRGLIVTKPDHQMIIELYIMREALEGTAARLAAQHASGVEVTALRGLIERESAKLTDVSALSAINQQIHRLIYSSAHNRYLLRSLSTLADTMTLLPTMLGDHERAKVAHEEHLSLIEAIEARDPDRAEVAARQHLRSAQQRRLEWLMENNDQ